MQQHDNREFDPARAAAASRLELILRRVLVRARRSPYHRGELGDPGPGMSGV
jgi:hypothetical protein